MCGIIFRRFSLNKNPYLARRLQHLCPFKVQKDVCLSSHEALEKQMEQEWRKSLDCYRTAESFFESSTQSMQVSHPGEGA
jgi:hypothetical protein